MPGRSTEVLKPILGLIHWARDGHVAEAVGPMLAAFERTGPAATAATVGVATGGAIVGMPVYLGIAAGLLGMGAWNATERACDRTKAEKVAKQLETLANKHDGSLHQAALHMRRKELELGNYLDLDYSKLDNPHVIFYDIFGAHRDDVEAALARQESFYIHLGDYIANEFTLATKQREEILAQLNGYRHILEDLREGQKDTKDSVLARLDQMEARMLQRLNAARPPNLALDDATERDLVDAVERLADDAGRGGMTAKSILESETPADLADYLAAKRSRLAVGKAALNAAIDAEAVKLDRELAAVAYTTGRINEAEGAVQRILDVLPDDLDAIAHLGRIHKLGGRLDEAEEYFRRMLELATGDPKRTSAALESLGNVARDRGDFAEALRLFSEALEVDRSIGYAAGIACAYNNIGLVYACMGDLHAAREMFQVSMERCKGLQMEGQYAATCTNLGKVKCIMGDLAGAEELHEIALAINQENGNEHGVAGEYCNFGMLHARRGQFDQAEVMFLRSLRIQERIGRPHGILEQNINLATVVRERGDYSGADVEILLRERLAREQLELQHRAHLYESLGTQMLSRGQLAGGREQWLIARDLFAKLGAQHEAEKVQSWIDALPRAE